MLQIRKFMSDVGGGDPSEEKRKWRGFGETKRTVGNAGQKKGEGSNSRSGEGDRKWNGSKNPL